jgi:hypothetical protein
MISKAFSIATIAAALMSSAAIAQSYGYNPGLPPPNGGGNTLLGPGPINEATPGSTTISGSALPRRAPIPANQQLPDVSSPLEPSGETGAIGMPNTSMPAVPPIDNTVTQDAKSLQNSLDDNSMNSSVTPMNTSEAPITPSGETGSINASQPVGEIPDARRILPGATVQSASGTTIGTVRSVWTDRSGTPQKVTVALNNSADLRGRTLGLAAEDLSYQSNGHLAMSELTDPEMQSLEAASYGRGGSGHHHHKGHKHPK